MLLIDLLKAHGITIINKPVKNNCFKDNSLLGEGQSFDSWQHEMQSSAVTCPIAPTGLSTSPIVSANSASISRDKADPAITSRIALTDSATCPKASADLAITSLIASADPVIRPIESADHVITSTLAPADPAISPIESSDFAVASPIASADHATRPITTADSATDPLSSVHQILSPVTSASVNSIAASLKGLTLISSSVIIISQFSLLLTLKTAGSKVKESKPST